MRCVLIAERKKGGCLGQVCLLPQCLGEVVELTDAIDVRDGFVMKLRKQLELTR
jgi:hypothetical protein